MEVLGEQDFSFLFKESSSDLVYFLSQLNIHGILVYSLDYRRAIYI